MSQPNDQSPLDFKKLLGEYNQADVKGDLTTIFRPRSSSPESPIKRLLFFAGLLSAVLPIGALIGFVFAYNKLDYKQRQVPPTLNSKPWAVYATMLIFAVFLPIAFLIVVFCVAWISGHAFSSPFFLFWVFGNLFISLIAFRIFSVWQSRILNYLTETQRHGSARFAFAEELQPFTLKQSADLTSLRLNANSETIKPNIGFFIGSTYFYNKSGHLLTVAGTRGGKGINLIVPNLLPSIGGFAGSWVIIDPKGENAAITANAQRRAGKKVVLLNPWDLLSLGGVAYNPLDLLKGDRLNLVDDIQLIAENIVPMASDARKDSHWDNRARTFISTLLLHLVTAGKDEEKHLGTLWQWLRLPADEWEKLLQDMIVNRHEHAGDIVRAGGEEILTMMTGSEKEYGGIMSTAAKWTDFLKSPALRDAVKKTKDFSSADLSDGNTVVYVIIPADRLKTHYQWLRLVVSSLMRSVVRNPQNDVCFLLDEFYALGYLSEIETALGTYAGYGVHVWAILQNLVQLKDTYGDNWENFISSCSVRHFFNISDNTTADYVAALLGQTSVPTFDALGNINGASGRWLVSPDELRRSSGNIIYTIIDQLPPAQFIKAPYFDAWNITEGKDYDKNPYFKS